MAYLDHAATTPMLPAAMAALTKELGEVGNPSSLHAAGRRARRVVEESREAIAAAFGARPSEVVFTAGGTEADNLAVKGLFWSRQQERRRPRILASSVEHHAVLDPVHWLVDHQGAEVVWLDVDAVGRVDPQQVHDEIARDPESVALVTVMWANNEVGTVQPIAECASVGLRPSECRCTPTRFRRPATSRSTSTRPASMRSPSAGTSSAGPLGVGALLLGRSATPTPLIHGGGQERDVRSGTLDTPSIAGFAAAATEAVETRAAREAAVAALRDDLVAGVLERGSRRAAER